MRNIYTIFFILVTWGTHAQLQTAHWYFGENAGLDFTSGSPISVSNGQINTIEGCSSISDENGNLLFYTDGVTVFNKNHTIMQNGYGLAGNSSSTQSALIVPKPETPNVYYIFTIWNSNGLGYSVVDMSLDGGNGAVTEKNIMLLSLNGPGGSEKLTAASMANCSGFWVLTHFVDSFYSFAITSEGVNHEPVISTVGIESFYPISGTGHIKLSPNGKKVAVAHYDFYSGGIGALALYDFDNAIGIVSNEVLIHKPLPITNKKRYYGVEFSPDNKLLYASYSCEGSFQSAERFLVQYNLVADSIEDTEYILNSWVGPPDGGALQLGLDNKIYHSYGSSNYLAVIINPNQVYNSLTGEHPNYNLEGVYLGEAQARLGLPSFITSLFYADILINGIENQGEYCEQELSFRYCHNGSDVSAVLWGFGDGTTSTEENPVHTYAPGTYTLSLHLTIGHNTYTTQEEITIHPLPDVQNAELDKCALENEEVIFDLTESYPQINPNEESVTYTFHLSEQEAENNENPQPTTYTTTTSSTTLWVRVENEWGCVSIVQLELIINLIPELTIETPEPVCTGNSATLEITTDVDNTVNWYESQTSTTPIFIGNPFETPELSETTTYWVEVVSGEGCPSERIELIVEVTDEIIPEFTQIPPVCYGETFTLPTESNNGITGAWTPEINTEETTTYTFTPEEGQCSAEYEMTVEIVPIPELILPEIPAICSGETISITVTTTGETVNWYENEFDTEPFHTGGTYTTLPLLNSLTLWLEAVDGNCKSARESITITVNELPTIEAEIPEPVCVGNSVELSVITNGNLVNWYESQNSTTPIFTGNPFITPPLNNSTIYYVEAVGEENCKSERIPIEAVITEEVIPEFTQIAPVCFGEPFTLPDQSINGIYGHWTPAINNTQTTTYTFIPDAGQCAAENQTMTVQIVDIPELILPEEDIISCIAQQVTITINSTGETVNWYANELDITPVHSGNTYTVQLSVTTTFWVEAQTGSCKSERQPITVTVYPTPEMQEMDDIVICDGDSYEFTAPEGFDYYEWKNQSGTIISNEAMVVFTQEGTYTLMAGINGIPCPVYRNLSVSFSSTPVITEIKSTENTLTVYVTGTGPFEYSLDNVFWQSSNIFHNLQPGIYFVYVRDREGCGTSAKQGAIMGVPNFISPNGDGKNDTWQIKALEAFPNTRLQIFDRYGKQFVDRILSSDFEWDGRYNGQPLPSGSYWYIITLETGEKLSGHISIRN